MPFIIERDINKFFYKKKKVYQKSEGRDQISGPADQVGVGGIIII